MLGVQEVLIPPASGAASALGFLAAPLSFEQVRSHPVRLDATGAAGGASTRCCDDLERETRARLLAAGVAEADIVVERSADMRLFGQLHEINVALPDGRDRPTQRCRTIRAAFAAAYAARYTSVYEGVGVQLVSLPRALPRAGRRSCRSTQAGGRA